MVEVLWKTEIMIKFRNTLHGFGTDRGMGNASLKANMFQQLVAMMEEVIYEIFLYIYINPMTPWIADAASTS